MYSAIHTLLTDDMYFKYAADDVIPAPSACAVCGVSDGQDVMNGHVTRYSPSVGAHRRIEPSDELRLRRMKARRELQNRK
jgi:hypothetical protein